ncbi:unnamed protein product [Acanthoscelides obtectus]|uniref:Uncharacterized protein n=1 Tax=Acanthoscelides obtectus TaxID=200917 RepID=A0A9P0LTA0_ACAOB|nr:unnamed protein product [Acanthoscelides obtectus]CAK1675410.1 hypothetical protein AOBTE_LOCUS30205 [Acanthoscelides obtectus]
MKFLLCVFAVVALMALFVVAEAEEVAPRLFQGFDSHPETKCIDEECYESCKEQSHIFGFCVQGKCQCFPL